MDARDERGILRAGGAPEDRATRHGNRRHPGRECRRCAVVLRVRQLTQRPARASRSIEVGARDSRRRPRLNRGRIHTQPERQGAKNGELRACIVAVEVARRVHFRVAAGASVRQRRVQRRSERLHPRQHRVRRPVEDAHDPGDAIAGEAVADGAHDWHGAADGRFESQLTTLARGERPERRAVARDDLLVGGDHRFARRQRAPNPVGRRVNAADRLDHEIDVALEDVVDVRRPDDTSAAKVRTLVFRSAIDDVSQMETANGVGRRQAARHGGPDGAESEDRDFAGAGVRGGRNDVK